MFCTACGTENPPGSRFCANCGAALPQPVTGGVDVTRTLTLGGARQSALEAARGFLQGAESGAVWHQPSAVLRQGVFEPGVDGLREPRQDRPQPIGVRLVVGQASELLAVGVVDDVLVPGVGSLLEPPMCVMAAAGS